MAIRRRRRVNPDRAAAAVHATRNEASVPTAVISDIHGNAVALRAALDDIDSKGIERIVCLGDIIGYGPDPLECVDLVRERCEWSLMGNHDFGVLYEPTNFNAMAEAAAFWSREQFDAEPDDELRAERYEFLGRMRVRLIDTLPDDGDGKFLCVHASPRRPVNEYIFPDDVEMAPDKLRAIFERFERVCLCGHTHVPGVFTDDLDFFSPGELGSPPVHRFAEDEKVVVNVGSIGQPRDHDPRASYAILYPDRIEFQRLEYDAAATAGKIRSIPELHDWLGDRLLEGR